jgi:RNA polymerase sigma-70 factor (ECF subfamily)
LFKQSAYSIPLVEERDLFNRIKNSDKEAFEIIFREYFHVLHEYAIFYIGNPQLAEDIVQDVFIKIWDSRDRLGIHSSLKGYLYRSVHNHCIQYIRHKKVEKNHHALQKAKLEEAILMNRLFFESGISKLFENDIESLVDEAISDLPGKTREIYILSRHKYLSNKEISKKVKLTEKSVEYHITRALEFLRKYLKDYLPALFISFMIFFQ